MADSGNASKAVASREENFKTTPGDGKLRKERANAALIRDEPQEGGAPEPPGSALPERSKSKKKVP
jgi:hypothetical protein